MNPQAKTVVEQLLAEDDGPPKPDKAPKKWDIRSGDRVTILKPAGRGRGGRRCRHQPDVARDREGRLYSQLINYKDYLDDNPSVKAKTH